jgi:hypothetical protein
MSLKQLGMLSSAFTLMLLTAAVSRADVITFQITGSSAIVASSGITFVCNSALTPPSCPAGDGNFYVAPGTTSGVGAPPANAIGSIAPLTEAPSSDMFPAVTNWLDVDGIDLSLTSDDIGTFAGSPSNSCGSPAFVGQTCTPIISTLVGTPGNPLGYSNFALVNTMIGPSAADDAFTASFTVDGTAVVDGVDYKWIGQFSQAVTGEGTFQDVLGSLPKTFSYAGSITLTSVPEPGFLPLFGGLAILVAFASLYRRVRTQQQ